MELGLAGKTVLVTGGSKGIGRATAHVMAAEGARVLICSRNQAALDEATRALIHRRWRCGFSIDVMAEQFALSRSRIERIINEVRAGRLLEAKLEYVSDPGFEDPAAAAKFFPLLLNGL